MKATTVFLLILSLSSSALAQSPAPAPPELPAGMQPPTQPQPQPEAQPQMQPGMQAKTPSASTGIFVHPKTKNGFTYMCGGVGLDESDYMKRAAKKYDLMSTFARQDGSYLANINIDISGKGGKASLQTTCSGPILLVKFPHAGSYSIRADDGGNAQTKTTQVPAKGSAHSMVFVWPAK